jgi:hypothetical protein
LAQPLVLSPGRRLALVLGVPFVLAAIVDGGFQCVSLVGQDSYRIAAITAPIANKVSVGVGNGDITVVPGTGKRAVISGVVNYSLFRPVVKWDHTATGTFLVGPNCFWAGNCGAELTLSTPAGEAVRATSSSGNVNARNLTGALDLQDASGDIVLNYVSGPLVLSASSGDITGTDLSATKVQANDSSGDVDLSFDSAPHEVDVSDASGDITVAVPANVSYSVVAKAGSGSSNVNVPTNPLSHNVIHLNDDSGDINVVPSGS